MDILQWIAIAFAAGFIGFFGKALGKALISFFHRKGASAGDVHAGDGAGRESFSGGASGVQKEQADGETAAKVVKKQQKALLKQEKKRLKDNSGE